MTAAALQSPPWVLPFEIPQSAVLGPERFRAETCAFGGSGFETEAGALSGKTDAASGRDDSRGSLVAATHGGDGVAGGDCGVSVGFGVWGHTVGKPKSRQRHAAHPPATMTTPRHRFADVHTCPSPP